MGLQDMIDIKLGIATRVMRRVGLPDGAAGVKFGLVHQQFQNAVFGRYFNPVAGFHQCKRAACLRLGRYVQNDGAISGA